MDSRRTETIEMARLTVGIFGGYRPAARALGLPISDATTLHDIANHKQVSDERIQRVWDSMISNDEVAAAWQDSKQDNSLRAALRVPPYWMAYSPNPPAPSVSPRGQD